MVLEEKFMNVHLFLMDVKRKERAFEVRNREEAFQGMTSEMRRRVDRVNAK
jgi:hypothetical protein